MTQKIEAAWIIDGKKFMIWSKGKADTDTQSGHL